MIRRCWRTGRRRHASGWWTVRQAEGLVHVSCIEQFAIYLCGVL